MFAVEHEGIEPDMMCVAKGITGGYLPRAPTRTTPALPHAVLGEPHENKTFFHGHTYTGNPLACAAASANLHLMEKNDTVARAAKTGELMGRLLQERLGDGRFAGDIRRRGMMAGIELVRDRETKEPFPAGFRAGYRVCKAAMDRGVRIRPLGDVVVLMPPLALEDCLVEHLVDVLAQSIDAATQEFR
jgi:adenosylmethionine-8-amino-7-oxononanoate aminotransferase